MRIKSGWRVNVFRMVLEAHAPHQLYCRRLAGVACWDARPPEPETTVLLVVQLTLIIEHARNNQPL
jgi:hypothetical protein